MPAVTGRQLITGAFQLLNVFMAGENVPDDDAEVGRTMMNDLLGEWNTRNAMTPFISRERFNLVANQGGEDDPYTIGDGGDFDTDRPSTQDAIVSANLILTSTSPEVRVPLGLYTDPAYDANAIPGMTSGQPTALYYNPTYKNDLGSIYLWPVPDTAENDLELFLQKQLPIFANLTTTYYVPDGLPRALKYNLAEALSDPYGRELGTSATKIAISSLSSFKRANQHMSDVPNDATFAMSIRRTLFNIMSGQ